jgi:hypothetical protein
VIPFIDITISRIISGPEGPRVTGGVLPPGLGGREK